MIARFPVGDNEAELALSPTFCHLVSAQGKSPVTVIDIF